MSHPNTMIMAMTVAKMGRFMKKLLNMVRVVLTGYFLGASLVSTGFTCSPLTTVSRAWVT